MLYEVITKVTVNNEELTWHALDSNLWNVKLFRFAYCSHLVDPERGNIGFDVVTFSTAGFGAIFSYNFV